MTNEIKKLIDELPVHECRGSFSLPPIELVLKSDVIALVEKLTGWTKVEEGLPEIDVKVLFKRYEGTIYFGKMWRNKCFEANCMTIEGVTEWKPMI